MSNSRSVRRRTADRAVSGSCDLRDNNNSSSLQVLQELPRSTSETKPERNHAMGYIYREPPTAASSNPRKRGRDQLLQLPKETCPDAARTAISPATPMAMNGVAAGADTAAAAAAAAAAAMGAANCHAPCSETSAGAGGTCTADRGVPATSPAAPATPQVTAAVVTAGLIGAGLGSFSLGGSDDWALSAASSTTTTTTGLGGVNALQRRKDPTRTVTSQLIWAPRGAGNAPDWPQSAPAAVNWLAATSSGGSGSFTQALEELDAAAAAAAATALAAAAGTPEGTMAGASTGAVAAPSIGRRADAPCLQTAGSSILLVDVPCLLAGQEAVDTVSADWMQATAAATGEAREVASVPPAPPAAAAAAAVAGASAVATTSSTTHSCSTAGADTATITSCGGEHMQLLDDDVDDIHQLLPDMGRSEGSWWDDVVPYAELEALAAGVSLEEPLQVLLPQLLSLNTGEL